MNQTLRSLFLVTTAGLANLGEYNDVQANDGIHTNQVITVTHPPGVKKLGGETQKQVDCGNLLQLEYSKEDQQQTGRKLSATFPTCEFIQQVDSNSQDICGLAQGNTNGDQQDQLGIAALGKDNLTMKYQNQELSASEITNALSTATIFGIQHLASVHGDCIERAGRLEQRAGGGPNKIFGKGWENKTSCSLVDAIKQCKSISHQNNLTQD